MSSSTVPLRVYAGPTCYEHFAVGKKDLYAPHFLMPNPPPEYTWRYGISADHKGTVFFHNMALKRSVWVLPAVDESSRQQRDLLPEESMRAEGTVKSARDKAREMDQEQQQHSHAAGHHHAPAGAGADQLGNVSDPVRRHVRGESSAGSSRSSSTSSAGAVQQRQTGAAPPPAGGATREQMRQAVQRALASRRAAAAAPAEDEAVSSPAFSPVTGAGLRGGDGTRAQQTTSPRVGSSVHERLAAWRARRAQEGGFTSIAVDGRAGQVLVGGATEPFPRSDSEDAPATSESRASSCAASVPSTTHISATAKASSPPAKSLEKPRDAEKELAKTMDAFLSALHAERDREEMKAASALQRERLAVMRQQEAALERQRRVQAEEETEELARQRMAHARRRAEEQRTAVDEGSGPAGSEEAAEVVNAFLARQQELLRATENETEASPEQRVAEAISCALQRSQARAATALASPEGPERAVDSPQPAASGLTGERAHRVPASAQAVRGRVEISPAFTYLGDLATSGEAATVSRAALRDRTNRPTAATDSNKALAEKGEAAATTLAELLAGTPGATPLPVREGHGTLHWTPARDSGPQLPSSGRARSGGALLSRAREENSAADSFFKGHWRDDKRDGSGVLSLPHVVLQGEWKEDALTPGTQCFLQTKRMKGVATVSGAKGSQRRASRQEESEMELAGPAKLALADGSRFAGNLERVRDAGAGGSGTTSRGARKSSVERNDGPTASFLAGPSAWQLSSKDEVEWCAEPSPSSSTAKPNGREGQPQGTASGAAAAGTGVCRVRFHNGDRYVGAVRRCRLHGYGRYDFTQSGCHYTGQFQRGSMAGEGTYVFADGDVYIGNFVAGCFDGVGCYVHKDKYLYEGEWAKGRMHGRGQLTFASGAVWKGQFENDVRREGRYLRVGPNA